MNAELDKAGESYWDQVWEGRSIPGPVNPRSGRLRDHVYLRFHRYFTRLFGGRSARTLHLLEVGCARSRWLPYFVREFGFEVSGIDYSRTGCDQAMAILNKAAVAGEITCADFFTPPESMLASYDVVVSFGVVEHFRDTSESLASLSKFLKPGGVMITVIPNMVGAIGWLQEHLCREIYEIHVPLDSATLASAHESAGLSVRSCRYFMGVHWGVLNLSCWPRFLGGFRQALPYALSLPFWFLEKKGLSIPPNQLTSPYIVCVAQRDA